MPNTLDQDDTASPTSETDQPCRGSSLLAPWGISRTSTYKARRDERLPFRTIHVGSQYVVTTRELRKLLGLPVLGCDGSAPAA
jgi:hypothetical protein